MFNISNKIFIIDNDINFTSSLQAKLGVNGFSVYVNNGNDSIENLINQMNIFKPDYIIQEIEYPKIDAFKLLQTIKSDSRLQKIPLFIFSNSVDLKEDKNKIENLGADYCFSKKAFNNIDEIVQKLDKIIANRDKK